MISKDEAKAVAWLAIAELVSRDYFRSHFEGSCQAYPDDRDDVEYEYFIGFDAVDGNDNKWKVFVRVAVDRETEKVTFLDYRLPDGRRMEAPVKPVRFA